MNYKEYLTVQGGRLLSEANYFAEIINQKADEFEKHLLITVEALKKTEYPSDFNHVLTRAYDVFSGVKWDHNRFPIQPAKLFKQDKRIIHITNEKIEHFYRIVKLGSVKYDELWKEYRKEISSIPNLSNEKYNEMYHNFVRKVENSVLKKLGFEDKYSLKESVDIFKNMLTIATGGARNLAAELDKLYPSLIERFKIKLFSG